MKVGIMQPYFLPYIGYWQLIKKVDRFVIYDDVNYIKGGWINRNNILMNGEAKLITINMNGASPNKLINEVGVSGDIVHKKKLLKTIQSCYKKAPYYYEVFPLIKDIIMNDESNLALYIEYSIRQICKYLHIDTELIISSEIVKNNELRSQDKVIEICKIVGAKEYYNSIGGKELYSYEDFKNQGIKLNFLKAKHIEYKQFTNEFVPSLSILDIMMFNSREDIDIMLRQYEVS